MARTAAENVSTDTATSDEAPKKRRVNRGARGPQPIYLFIKNDPNTGKPVVWKCFRDARKLAGVFEQAQAEGAQFLVTTPE